MIGRGSHSRVQEMSPVSKELSGAEIRLTFKIVQKPLTHGWTQYMLSLLNSRWL